MCTRREIEIERGNDSRGDDEERWYVRQRDKRGWKAPSPKEGGGWKKSRWIDTDGEVFVLTHRKNVDMSFMKVRDG